MLQKASKIDFPILIDIWERTVRATHDFLPEEEIDNLKPLILHEYFLHVLLHKYIQDGQIVGFIGTSSNNIEMLLIDPDFRSQGIGRVLTHFAIKELNIKHVDVNEQNLQALGFYKKLGFNVAKRSELDGQGKPYPILHLKI
ncbi:GNAT family N-acetyltransferase [Acinetobacter shaoyimingii]|uniref:GNAT family N-acetyltransferase n=1 Tax=Acinetobacter shaoyimingii TaxID=2715164 RepID=A0A6G8RSA9_9GAMM|nr:GNAT family N-acetyltransferase [Acinetobacter shaoyimingii]QIO04603.1 GNAT family N-acetyltransferase [Acinetobacter shaoyimingii]